MFRETSPTDSRRRAALARLAFVTVVVASLAVADEALADRVCSRPASETGRICTEQQCFTLQAVVIANCKTQQVFSCNKLTQCAALQEMKRRWTDCANARDRINAFCFANQDPGHRQASTQAWQNVGVCSAQIAKHCTDDPCPWLFGLTFQAPDAPPTSAREPPVEEPSMDFLLPVLEKLAAEGALEALLREGSGDNDEGPEN